MVVAITKTYTPEDLLSMPDGDRYELVDGQLLERNVSALSSYIAARIVTALSNFNDTKKFGWVFGDNTSFQCFPDAPGKVRKPDSAFITRGRMSVDEVRNQGHIKFAPDLVLEVVSPNDLAYEVNRKIEEWLEAGVKIVWVIDPEAKKVHIHRADGTATKLRESDDLSAEEVLPGFRCRISELFP